MEMDDNLAAVHAYLCADGYVIKNPDTQKHKYYSIEFRNTNLVLLKDFQDRFNKVFGIKPHLIEGQRCRIGSKEIYEKLTKEFGSFYSWHWKMPNLDTKLAKFWLRAYFDCEGWVICKTHQNRHIGVDCVNKEGLNQVEKTLNMLGIKIVRRYNIDRNIHRIYIYGKENLERFSKIVGFLHPDKSNKLKQVLNDYVVYKWNFPKNEEECKKFVINKLREKIRIKKPYFARMISKEESNLKKIRELLKSFYGIECSVNRCLNGIGTPYYELYVYRKEEIKKLINLKLIPNLFKEN